MVRVALKRRATVESEFSPPFPSASGQSYFFLLLGAGKGHRKFLLGYWPRSRNLGRRGKREDVFLSFHPIRLGIWVGLRRLRCP